MKTLYQTVVEEKSNFSSAEEAAIHHLNIAHAHLFEETCGRDVDNWLSNIDNIVNKLKNRIQ